MRTRSKGYSVCCYWAPGAVISTMKVWRCMQPVGKDLRVRYPGGKKDSKPLDIVTREVLLLCVHFDSSDYVYWLTLFPGFELQCVFKAPISQGDHGDPRNL